MRQDELNQAASKVIQAVRRTDEQGAPVYSEEEVRHFIPWMAFNMGANFRELSPKVQQIIVEFIAALELPEDPAPELVRERVDAFYEENPVNPRLVADVRRTFREGMTHLAEGRGHDEVRRMRQHHRAHGEVFRTMLTPAMSE